MNSAQSWTPLARDMDRALARAGLTTHEAALMQYVREHSWGEATRRKGKGKGSPWPDALAVAWSPGEIGRRINENPNRLTEAKASLEKSKMIVETPAGLVINKNAHQWVIPYGKDAGKPRLSPGAITYAMGAWPAPETAEVDPESLRESGDDSTGNPENPSPEIRRSSSGNPVKVLRKSGDDSPDFRRTPYKERGRGDSPRGEREKAGDGGGVPKAESRTPFDLAMDALRKAAPNATEDDLENLVAMCQLKADPTEAQEKAPRILATHARRYGLASVQAAVAKGYGKATGDLWPYLAAALQGAEDDRKKAGIGSGPTILPPEFNPPPRVKVAQGVAR